MLANPLYFLAFVFAATVGVSAQTTDACVLACVQEGLANSTCSSFTDLTCVCSSSSFQYSAAACLRANCTAADQAAALQLQQQECGSSSNSSNSTSSSKSSATSGSSPSSTSNSKSSATTLVEQLPFLSAVIAIAGVALGGAFAL